MLIPLLWSSSVAQSNDRYPALDAESGAAVNWISEFIRQIWTDLTGDQVQVLTVDQVSRSLLPLQDHLDDVIVICQRDQLLDLWPLVHQAILVDWNAVVKAGLVVNQAGQSPLPGSPLTLNWTGYQPVKTSSNRLASYWRKASPAETLDGLVRAGGCDLHMHTTASDGSDSPEELFARVRSSHLRAFSVTDHDVLSSIDSLANLATNGPVFVPGVEISVSEGRELHLLGYFPHGGHAGLEEFLETQRLARHHRNIAMVEQLRGLGYDVTLSELVDKGQGVVGRMQAAQLLIERGYVTSTTEAFEQILGFGKPGYIERPRPSLAEAIWQIRRLGGVPVLAHPALYNWCTGRSTVSDRLLAHLASAKAIGLLGVEAFHGEASIPVQQEVSAAARYLGLLRTCGSDDHGVNKINTTLYTGPSNFLGSRELLVVGALVRDSTGTSEPRYLLARRATAGHGFGQWELPGGKVEAGENPAAALTREIREELGVEAQVGPLNKLITHGYEDFRVILACFDTRLPDRDFHLTVHDRVCWKTVTEALELDLLAADISLFRALKYDT